jgi:phosphoenolpyruvate-protein phosphotransferase
MKTTENGTETRFAGLPISGGTAIARVCMFNENRHGDVPLYRVSHEAASQERERLQQAIAVAAEQLDRVIADVREQVGPAEARIFEAHKAILTDHALIHEVSRRIQAQQANVETALVQTLDGYQSRLLQMDDEYIRDRASDIGEVQRRLLDVLADRSPELHCGDHAACRRGRDRIIVAEELTPTLAVGWHAERVRGFVTERGGATSHAAILARGLGIPAVSGIKDIYRILDCGTELLLNGDTGEVVVWPNDETRARYRSTAESPRPVCVAVPPVPGLTLLANISRVSDAALAVDHQAEGIGLYRTEMEFFAAGRILGEEEQYERYSAVLRAMEGKPVCVRLLDLGGDKSAPFFGLPREDNPSLGLRGSRLLLTRRDLLHPQARALARASAHGPVDVLYPMIVGREQFIELKTDFLEATADLPAGQLRHGVMFEVPSACLQARELLQVAEFGSIGTNDLIQFLYAADRNDPLVAGDALLEEPAFWSLLSQIAIGARETGRTVSICGDMASHVRFLPALTKTQLTTLSVSPRFIPELRRAAAQQGR